MNISERKEFWKVLCSLNGNDKESDSKILSISLDGRYPRYLYRYREVNTNTLEALRTNKMPFSSANYFDDPFDTFLRINVNELVEFIEKNDLFDVLLEEYACSEVKANSNIIEDIKNTKKILHLMYKDDKANFLINEFKINNLIKKDTKSICFSENGLNETLWLKYANQYKGFALEYDTTNQENYMCGKESCCRGCENNINNSSLYPICYADEKFNATELAKYIFQAIACEKSKRNLLMPEPVWYRERVVLIKKLCHQYDEEWRIIGNPYTELPLRWRPTAVILGFRMSDSDKNLVKGLAQVAGVKDVYQTYIDDNGDLKKRISKTREI